MAGLSPIRTIQSDLNANHVESVKRHLTSIEQRIDNLEKTLILRLENKTQMLNGRRQSVPKEQDWPEVLADVTTVHGLKEVLTETRPALKTFWIVFFLAAIAFTGYYINRVVSEYRNEPTATKVRLLRQQKYDFPVMLLCPDTWLDAGKALSLNLSAEGLQYALGYLINYGVEPAPYNIEDVATAQSDFERWWSTSRFKDLGEFFKEVALDSSLFIDDCSYCHEVGAAFGKLVMNQGVCYNLSLAPTDGRVSLSDLEYLHVRLPDLSRGFLLRKTYWRLIVNPDTSLGMSDTHFSQVFPARANTIRIMPHHFKSLPNRNCSTLEQVRRNNCSQSCCVTRCYLESLPCYPLPLLPTDALPKDIANICNTANLTLEVKANLTIINDNITQLKPTPDECIDKCPSLCEKWIYETSVESHVIELELQESENKSSCQPMERQNCDAPLTTLQFLNQISHYGGILSHEEVATYSFETLISNVGGQLGLWLGASIMSLIQLCLHMINICGERLRRKSRQRQSTTVLTTKV